VGREDLVSGAAVDSDVATASPVSQVTSPRLGVVAPGAELCLAICAAAAVFATIAALPSVAIAGAKPAPLQVGRSALRLIDRRRRTKRDLRA
jgi:hypothetical protein